jgi:hypothetical protein
MRIFKKTLVPVKCVLVSWFPRFSYAAQDQIRDLVNLTAAEFDALIQNASFLQSILPRGFCFSLKTRAATYCIILQLNCNSVETLFLVFAGYSSNFTQCVFWYLGFRASLVRRKTKLGTLLTSLQHQFRVHRFCHLAKRSFVTPLKTPAAACCIILQCC